MKIPFWLLRLLPMWDYICPACRKEVKKNSHKCPSCGEIYGEPLRVPPKVLKDAKALEDYVHRIVFPRVSKAQRNYLAQYFTEILRDGQDGTRQETHGDFGAWDGTYTYETDAYVAADDVTNPHHGNRNFLFVHTGTVSQVFNNAFKSVAGYNPVHIRIENFKASMGGTDSELRFLGFGAGTGENGLGYALAYATFVYYNSAWHWAIRPRSGGAFSIVYGGEASEDTNYTVELAIYRHSSAGYAKLYVNGELEVEATGLNNVDRELNYVWLGHCYSAKASQFSADCVVVADAYIGPESETYTKTWQTDVLFKKLGVTKSLGADAAFQKRDIQLTVDADVLFKRLGVEKTADIDVLLKALGIQKTAEVDALLRKLDLLETFGVDTALIKRNIIRSFGVDVHFGALVTEEISRQIDVLFKRLDTTKTFGLVVYFGPVKAETYAKNFALDVIFAYKVRLPELWLDENGKMVLNISKPYTWVGT